MVNRPVLGVAAVLLGMLATLVCAGPVVFSKDGDELSLATAESSPRMSLPFDYGWRFRFGHASDGAPGPGNSSFNDIAGYGCTNMEHNPNRFTAGDCMMGCAYNPDCMVWQQDGQKHCYHGGSTAVCSKQTKPEYAFGGQRKVAPPVHTEYQCAEKAFNDQAWQVVDVPHDFVVHGNFVDMADSHHGYLPRNVSWYRKSFHLPASFKGKHIMVHFEGVFHVSQVWVNGQYVLMHNCGYTGFTVRLDNVTGLEIGTGNANVIAVRADATFGSGHWYEGGGIYRRTHLVSMDHVHFTHNGVFVSPETSSETSGTIRAQAEIEATGDSTGTAVAHFFLIDPAGKVVLSSNTSSPVSLQKGSTSTVTVTLAAESIKLWSIQEPNLYTVNVQLELATHLDSVNNYNVTDVVNVTTGFRQTSWSSAGGFKLNNKGFKLRGFSHHNSFTGVGVAIPDRIHLFRAQASRAVGGSFWRMSHNPYLPALYDFLDAVGIITWDENRDYGIEYVGAMHDMVKRDRHHPSIVIWSYCNEYECLQVSNQTGLAFRAAAKALDPQRDTAANGKTDGLDVQGMSHAGNNSFANFHKQYPDMPLVLSECCSCQTQRKRRVETTTCMHLQNSPGLLPYVAGSLGVWTLFDYYGESGSWPSVTSSFGNFDVAGFPKPHAYWYVLNWLAMIDAADHGRPPVATGPVTRVLELAEDIATSVAVLTSEESVELYVDGKSNGKTLSPGTGEPVIIPLTGEKCTFPYNVSGVQCHKLRKEASATNAMLCASACCEMAGCTVWQYAPIAGCWIGDVDRSNCSHHPKEKWEGGGRDTQPPLSVSNITAASLDVNNQVVGVHTVLRGGQPKAITLTLDVPSNNTGTGMMLVLDGHDAALVRASVVDEAGVVLTNASANITFTVTSGPGRLIGVGNGDNYCHQNAKSSTIPIYGGHARGIFQVNIDCVSEHRDIMTAVDVDHGPTEVQSGSCSSMEGIEIEATGEGLETGKLQIEVSSSADDLPLPVARRSVNLESYPYLTEFVG